MTAKILEEVGTLAEQRLILPGYFTWEQFEDLESLMGGSSLGQWAKNLKALKKRSLI